jgi:hypothetical protein
MMTMTASAKTRSVPIDSVWGAQLADVSNWATILTQVEAPIQPRFIRRRGEIGKARIATVRRSHDQPGRAFIRILEPEQVARTYFQRLICPGSAARSVRTMLQTIM